LFGGVAGAGLGLDSVGFFSLLSVVDMIPVSLFVCVLRSLT
jgi:hypothetical protein